MCNWNLMALEGNEEVKYNLNQKAQEEYAIVI